MATFVHALVSSTDERWQEVDLLISAAAQHDASSELHDALCRATIVMIVAHFEGFIKDLARATISDINKYSSFKKSPTQLKRTFCRTFTGINSTKPSKDENEREERLVELLDGLDTKFDPTLLSGGTANPKPDVIVRIFEALGVKSFFSLLSNSDLEVAFLDSDAAIYALLQRLREHIVNSVDTFPYNVRPADFNLSSRPQKSDGATTLWETFLDNLLAQRHEIAHGSSMENRRSVEEIKRMHTKAQILMYAAILTLCNKQAEIARVS